jgi:hypothetical protein
LTGHHGSRASGKGRPCIAKGRGFIFPGTFSRVVPGLPEGTNPRAFSPTTCQWFPRSPVRRPGLFAFSAVLVSAHSGPAFERWRFVLPGFANLRTRTAWNVLISPELVLRLQVARRPRCVYGGARLVSNSLPTCWSEITIWGGAIGTGRTDGKRVSVMPNFAGRSPCRESPGRQRRRRNQRSPRVGSEDSRGEAVRARRICAC